MTEPSKEVIKRANALIRAVTPENVLSSAKVQPDRNYRDDAFCRFIQEVSDAAKASVTALGEPQSYHMAHIGKFILPDPKPDVVEEVWHLANKSKDHFRSAIAEGGYKISKVSE